MIGGIISPRLARKITAAYHCAGCWSPLRVYLQLDGEGEAQYMLECEYCGSDIPGLVTRTYIKWRTEHNEEEYGEAKKALQEIYPALFPPPRPVQICAPVESKKVNNFLWNWWNRVWGEAQGYQIDAPKIERESIEYDALIEVIKKIEFTIKMKKLEMK